MLRPGDAAPDFVLPGIEGDDVRLSSFSGRAIGLCFLGRLSDPTTGLWMKRLQARADAIQEADGRLVAVALESVQGDVDERYGVADAMLDDHEGHAHDLYEAWRTRLLGRNPWAARRCSYLIDSDGIIRKVYVPINVLTQPSTLVRDMRRLGAQDAWGSQR